MWFIFMLMFTDFHSSFLWNENLLACEKFAALDFQNMTRMLWSTCGNWIYLVIPWIHSLKANPFKNLIVFDFDLEDKVVFKINKLFRCDWLNDIETNEY